MYCGFPSAEGQTPPFREAGSDIQSHTKQQELKPLIGLNSTEAATRVGKHNSDQLPPITHLSVGRRSPQLILPLLMVGLPLAPSLATLMPVVPGDT